MRRCQWYQITRLNIASNKGLWCLISQYRYRAYHGLQECQNSKEFCATLTGKSQATRCEKNLSSRTVTYLVKCKFVRYVWKEKKSAGKHVTHHQTKGFRWFRFLMRKSAWHANWHMRAPALCFCESDSALMLTMLGLYVGCWPAFHLQHGDQLEFRVWDHGFLNCCSRWIQQHMCAGFAVESVMSHIQTSNCSLHAGNSKVYKNTRVVTLTSIGWRRCWAGSSSLEVGRSIKFWTRWKYNNIVYINTTAVNRSRQ